MYAKHVPLLLYIYNVPYRSTLFSVAELRFVTKFTSVDLSTSSIVVTVVPCYRDHISSWAIAHNLEASASVDQSSPREACLHRSNAALSLTGARTMTKWRISALTPPPSAAAASLDVSAGARRRRSPRRLGWASRGASSL